jgi:hypothetical protein
LLLLFFEELFALASAGLPGLNAGTRRSTSGIDATRQADSSATQKSNKKIFLKFLLFFVRQHQLHRRFRSAN